MNSLIRILLIEDDEDDYILTRALLSEIVGVRLTLEWVATYDAALEEIGQKQHDLYLVHYRTRRLKLLPLVVLALAIGLLR